MMPELTAPQMNAYLGILVSLVILPTVGATYYMAFKARQEAKQAREGLLHSKNCLEFITTEGNCINLVPLETLHSLPKPGDVVLLPGRGMDGLEVTGGVKYHPGAYRIERIEHIYTEAELKGKQPGEARLTKAVAMVTWLH